ncbi:hypothetical protein Tco_1435957 [Tanacetum coccineum]
MEQDQLCLNVYLPVEMTPFWTSIADSEVALEEADLVWNLLLGVFIVNILYSMYIMGAQFAGTNNPSSEDEEFLKLPCNYNSIVITMMFITPEDEE